jgi:hypothetical protein
MPSTVIVLGAGASTAEGAPVQSNLLRDYFKSYQSRAEGANYTEMDVELRTYFNSFWGIDIDHADLDAVEFPTFEEALGLLELAQTRGEFFRDFGGLDQHTTRGQQLRQWLIVSIAMILREKLENIRGVHRQLVSNLAQSSQLGQIRFISLNYDIIVDNAISEAGHRQYYGVKFRSGDNLLGVGSRVILHKIHGSLNWLYCPTCGDLDLHPGEKIAADYVGNIHKLACGCCQEQRVPIIIPPSFYKAMTNPFLQQILLGAEKSLRSARHIIFCGYSFPDADLHFKYLLKRAEINRNGLPPRIYIVNEHVGKAADARTLERQRYIRFFRDKQNVHWTQLSFEQFANAPASVLDLDDCDEQLFDAD